MFLKRWREKLFFFPLYIPWCDSFLVQIMKAHAILSEHCCSISRSRKVSRPCCCLNILLIEVVIDHFYIEVWLFGVLKFLFIGIKQTWYVVKKKLTIQVLPSLADPDWQIENSADCYKEPYKVRRVSVHQWFESYKSTNKASTNCYNPKTWKSMLVHRSRE